MNYEIAGICLIEGIGKESVRVTFHKIVYSEAQAKYMERVYKKIIRFFDLNKNEVITLPLMRELQKSVKQIRRPK